MKMTIASDALAWFKEEWGFTPGDQIRFFARYGGSSTVQDSYSMGISKETPREIGISTVVEGITFYIESEDLWYLNGMDLTVQFRKETEEIVFLVQ
ncbi:HesB/YadR/YfhF family protein [Brevibacillus migulae]|uniref:HesB/YadR/YfhF family protein n=1 Tax=Brevibacillus migulae TaxID=1644114 RepID=UPI00106ED0B7|nr:HesB/YadR/YfhF family protein [Brevibacillus migulae]